MLIKDQKVLRLSTSIAIIICLFGMLIAYLTTSGMDGLVSFASQFLKYKVLLIISIFLLFALLFSLFYYRNLIRIINIKSSNNNIGDSINNPDTIVVENKPDLKYLHELSKDEKEYLKKYIDNETKTQNFHLGDGVVDGLCNAKILYRTSNFGVPMTHKFVFNIDNSAFKYLMKHKYLLK